MGGDRNGTPAWNTNYPISGNNDDVATDRSRLRSSFPVCKVLLTAQTRADTVEIPAGKGPLAEKGVIQKRT